MYKNRAFNRAQKSRTSKSGTKRLRFKGKIVHEIYEHDIEMAKKKSRFDDGKKYNYNRYRIT